MEKINKYGLGSNNRELVVTDKYGNVKSIFQNKISLTTLGSSGPSTFVNNILNIPNYSLGLSGYVTGTGTANYVARWIAPSQIGIGTLYDNGTNVGIGTVTPSFKLEVQGTGFFNDHLFIANGSSLRFTTNSIFIKPELSGGFWRDLAFYTGASEKMRITDGGPVGIGTTTPSQLLHVNGRALVNQLQYTRAINYSNSDLNSLTNAGFYDGELMTNAPNTGWFYVTVETHSNSIDWIHQTATSFGSANTANEVYTRVRVGGTWGAWKQLTSNTGTVTSVATTGPITGGPITGSGTIGITQATTSTDGYLSSTDWNTFNNKQNTLSLTTTGTSGPATLTLDSLNIPDYSSGPKGLFAQTAKSVPITNTTQEQSLIYVNFERRVDQDGGVTESLSCMDPDLRYYGSVGALSVPANSFRVGDSFHANLGGVISSQNNQDIDIMVMANGGATALALATIRLAATTNKFFDIVITFTVRAIGAAGVAKIATSGQFTYSKNASNAFEGIDFIYINDDTFDTTINNTLDITAKWSAASTSNSIYSEIFTLQKIY